MSGVEFLAVIGGISAIVTIANSASSVYSSEDLHGLPEAFFRVASRLPIVREALESTYQRVQAEKDEAVRKVIRPILKRCKANIKALEKTSKILKPRGKVKRLQRYYKAVKAMGKASKVERLMANLIKDVKLLSSQRAWKRRRKTIKRKSSRLLRLTASFKKLSWR